MTHAVGTKLGGIRTIEDIRLRCYCQPETGCWHWRGAAKRKGDKVIEPRVWLADARKCSTLSRASWSLAKGVEVADGKTVWRKCLQLDCGNPDHMMTGTKKKWGDWVKRKGYLRGLPVRVAINRKIKIKSGQTKMTMEMAEQIRRDPRTGVEIAAELGVSSQVVSRIRTRKTFVPVVASSVFSWAQM